MTPQKTMLESWDSEEMPRDYARLVKIYPLFEWSWNARYKYADCRSDGASWHVTFTKFGVVDMSVTQGLDAKHCQTSIRKRLEEQYPSLYISVHIHLDGIYISTWIMRDGRDCEPIGESISICDPGFPQELSRRNDIAAQAAKEGMFYCNGHERPEPMTDYGYHYFAGLYCKAYGEENPMHREKAAKETYN